MVQARRELGPERGPEGVASLTAATLGGMTTPLPLAKRGPPGSSGRILAGPGLHLSSMSHTAWVFWFSLGCPAARPGGVPLGLGNSLFISFGEKMIPFGTSHNYFWREPYASPQQEQELKAVPGSV